MVAGARAGAWLNLLARQPPRRKNGHAGLSSSWTGSMRTRLGRPRPGDGPASPRCFPAAPLLVSGSSLPAAPTPAFPTIVPPESSATYLRRRIACRCRRWPRRERRAKQELQDLLAGDQIAVDVVGYIAGSGGGLTRDDLSALTGAPPHKLDPVLRGVFGRSLHTRASADPATRRRTRPHGSTCSRTRPCGSPPKNNSAANSPATGKRSMDGSSPMPMPAGPIPPRATPFAATRAC